MTEYTDPAGHGAGRIGSLTVLFDEGCPICRTARRWLGGRSQLVPLSFVPAGTAEARARFPGLDHEATLRDLTVIADNGYVYVGDGAWVACLWALTDYRGMAERLTSPRLLPTARRFIAAASAAREATRQTAARDATRQTAARESIPQATPGRAAAGTREPWVASAADYGDVCDDRCR